MTSAQSTQKTLLAAALSMIGSTFRRPPPPLASVLPI